RRPLSLFAMVPGRGSLAAVLFRVGRFPAALVLVAPVAGLFLLVFLFLVIVVVFGRGVGFLLLQPLPVGDGDLVVVGVDLVEGQKTVAIAAEIDESCLQR